jgi:hypothetical protein
MLVAKRALGCVSLALACTLVSACAAETTDDADSSEADLQSSPLGDSDLVPYPHPGGMPNVWAQPDSSGFFEEGGKCGPTAVANLLRLYKIERSPTTLDAEGVHWVVGTRGITIRDWLDAHAPSLGCTLEHPTDGPSFLHDHLAAGHPVLVWFNMQGGLASHWVTAVGIVASNTGPRVVVMSWGRYYSIDLAKLDAAWRNVYLIRRPSIVCAAKTKLL